MKPKFKKNDKVVHQHLFKGHLDYYMIIGIIENPPRATTYRLVGLIKNKSGKYIVPEGSTTFLSTATHVFDEYAAKIDSPECVWLRL